MTSDTRRALEETATLYGVETARVDADGHRWTPPEEVILAVLSRLGAPLAGATDAEDAARERRREIWRRTCPPVRVAAPGQVPSVPLRLRAERVRGPLAWTLVCDRGGGMRRGEVRADALGLAGGSTVDGESFEIRRLELPADLPIGYHRLTVRHGADEHRGRVLVAPERVWRSERLRRSWGFFHPLYGLRDDRRAGVGDFRTLAAALDWTAARGGVLFGTTPLCAGFAHPPPVDPSPYRPASRLFWDDRYVDLESAPGFAAARAAGELGGLSELADRRSDTFVPWDELSRAHEAALATLARRFFDSGGAREAAFRRFLSARPRVADFARFQAARRAHGADWRTWPEPARSGRLAEGGLDGRVVRRQLYGQWVAARQIDDLVAREWDRGAGLFLDIPLGTAADGYDVWRHREQFVLDVSAGAPPDDFFRGGQNWGLPPLHPERIRENGFDYVAEVLRHAMEPAALVRVDHVMQLHRLYWIPDGAAPGEGVYVRYPAEELAAVLAIESHRALCDVAGEDLGTVPDAVRDLMGRRGIRRTHVLGFDLGRAADVPPPELFDVPTGAVATVGTHDMVPLAGLRQGLDLDEREAAGLIPEEEAAVLRARRVEAFGRLDARFGVAAAPVAVEGASDGSDGADSPCDPLLEPLLAGLGASDAGVVSVSLDDLFGVREPQNVPGTGGERPNWRRRLPARLGEGLPEAARKALAALRSARRRPTSRERYG